MIEKMHRWETKYPEKHEFFARDLQLRIVPVSIVISHRGSYDFTLNNCGNYYSLDLHTPGHIKTLHRIKEEVVKVLFPWPKEYIHFKESSIYLPEGRVRVRLTVYLQDTPESYWALVENKELFEEVSNG